MMISMMGGPQYGPQNTGILILGPDKDVPLILENYHLLLVLKGGMARCMGYEKGDTPEFRFFLRPMPHLQNYSPLAVGGGRERAGGREHRPLYLTRGHTRDRHG